MRAEARLRTVSSKAFTLYEVLMAALVLAMGLLGALALFPKALDLQKLARQRVLAASVAYDIATRHASGFEHNARTGRDEHALVRSVNNPNLLKLGLRNSGNVDRGNWRVWMWTGSGGNTQSVARTGSTDADFRMYTQDSMRSRAMGPVPPQILDRLDSEHDEIKHLAEQGIGVFYLWPFAVNNSISDGDDLSISDEAAHPLIFAAVGHPQINASFHSPSHFHSFEMIDEAGGYDHPLSWIWRRHARFPTTDPSTGDMVDGDAHWRGLSWEPWRWKYWNAWKQWNDNGRVDSAIVDYYSEENNAAFVFPFKYYLWDYEVQIVNPYFEWERLARRASHKDFSPSGGIRDFEHGTTGLFDPQEDSDLAFPIQPKLSNSLFVPFEPSHRCRELVFWSVNWKDYEDAELVSEGLQNDIALHQQGTQGWDGHVGRMQTATVHQLRFLNNASHGRRPYMSADNPILRTNSVHPRVWGGRYDALASYERWFDWHWHIDYAITRVGQKPRDDGTLVTVDYRDRNFNETLDLGPVPKSVRLRARTVARFVVYDKRLHATY